MWDILEQLPSAKRSEIPETAYDDFIKDILSLNAEYTLTVDDIKEERFIPKGITEPEEAFEFMNTLNPSLENAFLFNKRLFGISY